MRFARRVRTRPVVVAALLAWGVGCLVSTYGGPLGDWLYFRAAARSLLAAGVPAVPGGPFHLYAEMPELQFGPPAIVLTMPFLLGDPSFSRVLAASSLMLAGGSCLFAIWRARAMAALPDADRMLLVGGLAVVPAWASVASGWMHLDDAVALTCLAWAVPQLLRGRWWAAAVLLGLGAATKPWAAVLLPLLLALPRADWAKSGLVAVLVAVAPWAPFLIADPTTTTALSHVRTPVSADSTIRLLGVARDWSPHGLRLLQLGVCSLGALLAVRRGQWQAAALVALALRVATDAETFAYYGTGPVLAALVWDWLSPRRWPVATVAAFVVEFAVPVVSTPTVTAAVRLLATVLLVVHVLTRQGGYRVASQLSASR